MSDCKNYWIVLDDPNNFVCSDGGFISCETVFDEATTVFYGLLMCRTITVGFSVHINLNELALRELPAGVVDIEGNGFMGVYLQTPLFPREVFDNGDELFGDLSLHRNDLGRLAFCIHNVDENHPLFSVLDAKR